MAEFDINTRAQNCRSGLNNFLKDLVRIPSVCGREETVIKRIKEEAAALEYDQIRVDVFGNLMARRGNGSRILAIDGHCDTVDTGLETSWPYGPYSAEVHDGVLYGRGAADQKSGLAAALYAGKLAADWGLPRDCSVLVVASVMEEDFEGLCWRHIIEKDKCVPEAVLLTEPSDLGIRCGQRGRLEIEIEVHGVSCHGSAPELGDNAVYKSLPLIRSIEALNKRLKGPLPLGKGSVVLTRITSSAPSLCAVPDHVKLHLDRRLAAGETMDSAVREIQSFGVFQKNQANFHVNVPDYQVKTYTGYQCMTKAHFPTWLMDPKHDLVSIAENAYQEQFDENPDLGVWRFSTNGAATQGLHSIPTVGFGPGRECHAHTAEDQVRLDDVFNAMLFYSRFIRLWSRRSA